MDKSAVINASPLVFLTRGNHIELLKHFADRIYVPEPVAKEIRAKGSQDISSKVLDKTSWLEVVPSSVVPDIIGDWGLGPGESSVLAMAYDNPGFEAIIDDLSGRKCAAFLQIPLRGTLGIILTAKKRGLIPEARPVLEELIHCGLYLSKTIVDESLKRVGE